MKCDEVKPVCGACAKGNRACLYGALPPVFDATDPAILHAERATHEADDYSTPARANSTTASPDRSRSHASFSVPTAATKRASFSDAVDNRPSSKQWPTTPTDDSLQAFSPQSSYSNSTAYGTEVAPLRWFGLLAGDVAQGTLDLPSLESLSDAALAQRYELHRNGVSTQVGRLKAILEISSFRMESAASCDL